MEDPATETPCKELTRIKRVGHKRLSMCKSEITVVDEFFFQVCEYVSDMIIMGTPIML